MKHGQKIGMAVDAQLVVNRGIAAHLGIHRIFEVECRDQHGRLKWVERVENLIPNEGLDHVLSNYYKASAFTEDFSVGLVDLVGWTAFAAGDTGAQIDGTNGWDEFKSYSEAVRQDLVLGAVSGQSVDNSASKASFSINASGTVKGAFIVHGDNVKGGTTGTLGGEALFAADRAVANLDTLNVTVTITTSSV